MLIKITANLYKRDNTTQYIDTDKPINRLRTYNNPCKGEDIITELFIKAIQDAKDVAVLRHISYREVLRFYYIELAYYEEQQQYLADFIV